MAAQAEAAKVTMAFDQDEFFACARYGELDDLKKELDKGADVNGKGPGGLTALHGVCRPRSNSERITRRGRGHDASERPSNTPAHYAANKNKRLVLKLV